VCSKNSGDIATHDAAADDYCMFVGAGHFRFLVGFAAGLLVFSIISSGCAGFVSTIAGMV
jgi:hypothetical protein